MNWKCKIGLHDWEPFNQERFPVTPPKVCLRCGKIDDKVIKKEREWKRRQQKSEELTREQNARYKNPELGPPKFEWCRDEK